MVRPPFSGCLIGVMHLMPTSPWCALRPGEKRRFDDSFRGCLSIFIPFFVLLPPSFWLSHLLLLVSFFSSLLSSTEIYNSVDCRHGRDDSQNTASLSQLPTYTYPLRQHIFSILPTTLASTLCLPPAHVADMAPQNVRILPGWLPPAGPSPVSHILSTISSLSSNPAFVLHLNFVSCSRANSYPLLSQDEANLARIRDNQRRSRARRKEYQQELEQRVRAFEEQGVEASTEVQQAARRVAEENKKLRALLNQAGISHASIETYLRTGDASTGIGESRGGSSTAIVRPPAVGGNTVQVLEHLMVPRFPTMPPFSMSPLTLSGSLSATGSGGPNSPIGDGYGGDGFGSEAETAAGGHGSSAGDYAGGGGGGGEGGGGASSKSRGSGGGNSSHGRSGRSHGHGHSSSSHGGHRNSSDKGKRPSATTSTTGSSSSHSQQRHHHHHQNFPSAANDDYLSPVVTTAAVFGGGGSGSAGGSAFDTFYGADGASGDDLQQYSGAEPAFFDYSVSPQYLGGTGGGSSGGMTTTAPASTSISQPGLPSSAGAYYAQMPSGLMTGSTGSSSYVSTCPACMSGMGCSVHGIFFDD